ncbi:MAG: GGDEF domain-containing protein, partial [Planctomycetia bacterium]|nr:GGDEF domain-containing protein [Planctomycetia bacterium]
PGDGLDDDLNDLLAEPEAENDEETTATEAHETLDPGVPENWDLNEKFVETSVLKLNIAMMKSGARATEIDARLRAARGHSDAQTIHACLGLLKEDCQTYLAEQGKAAEQFHDRIGELGELSALGDEIEMTNLEQAAQIETTLSNLENMDFETDLEAANKRLLEEISHLRRARHKLRDSQDEAFLAIARNENRIGKVEKQLYHDSLTKLVNRIGLEATLHEWWEAGRPRSHSMSAAMLDLDQFERINEKHGSLVGDRILNRLAEFVRYQFGPGNLVARFSGQRFFVMMCDAGPRAAVKKVEFIRQGIEKATFLRDTEEIRVTAAGALTEVKPDDAVQSVFDRLDETIRQAKHAGPNQTFAHDGKTIERVESPNLGAKYAEFRI